MTNDIGLRCKAIPHVGHVVHVNRGAIDGLDREIIQFGNALWTCIQLNLVFQRTDLGSTGRQYKVLCAESIHDVHGGQALRLQRARIDINLNLSLLATIGIRNGSARNGDQLRANEVHTLIKKLLLGKRAAAQPELKNGNAGSGVLND